ncbi:secreted RxLR effector protein 161-like [Prunus dulcis]|uniref:secreted RxLR effector protein 161-like n=1 Tax=Prunus dulcis TaxID=3755 RepID=UPI001483990A|nr:secreted RxLR effector protein 161-like [Prunus dulcis]
MGIRILEIAAAASQLHVLYPVFRICAAFKVLVLNNWYQSTPLGPGLKKQQLSSCSSKTELHYQAAKRVLRYLKGTVDYGLFYKKGKSNELVGFSDSDYAGDLEDRKSTSGHVFMLSSGAVSWSSKKQQVVTLSTTEAEFIAAASCACQAVWLRRILEELHFRRSLH